MPSPSHSQQVPAGIGFELTTMVSSHVDDPPRSSFLELGRISPTVAGIANTLQQPASMSLLAEANEPLLLEHREQVQGLPKPELPRYANRELLSRFIPGTDPEQTRAQTFRVRMSRRSTMLMIQIMLAAFTTVANIVLTVWAVGTSRPQDGVGTLFEGACDHAAYLNTMAHVVLNVLASLFLGAGNYCMQVLVSPSPEEMEEEHARKGSYDIGIHSLQNLRNIHVSRRLLWLSLGVISTLLHLIWNSAVFPSIPFTQFPAAVVTRDFLTTQDDWAISRPGYFAGETQENRTALEALRIKALGFDRKDNLECIRAYSNALEATAELVLVTDELSASYNGSSLIHGWINGNGETWTGSSDWVCYAESPVDQHKTCSEEWVKSFRGDWKYRSNEQARTDKIFNIQYCLMGKPADSTSPSRLCGLHYNFHLLVLIIILTGMDTALICYVAKLHKNPTLVLLGDAIAHSLKTGQDHDTNLLRRPQNPDRSSESIAKLGPDVWPEIARRWSSAVSKRTWVYSLCLFAAGILVGLTMLCAALIQLGTHGLSISMPSLWAYGLGRTTEHSIVSLFGLKLARSSTGRATQVVFANSYQVMVSFLYLFYNNILTRQVLADEMIRFLRHRKALRVSSPQNLTQRSSYFLTLPWKYAAPQMSMFIVLHWLVSQSVFTVQTRGHGPGPDGPRIPGLDDSRVGFSAIGIVFSTGLGAILVVALVLNSRRKYNSPVPEHFPRMASNSVAIAANCCRPQEDKEAYLYPVQLGVVSHGLNFDDSTCKGRVTFSSDAEIQPPKEHEMYEMAQWIPKQKAGFSGRAKSMFRSMMRSKERNP